MPVGIKGAVGQERELLPVNPPLGNRDCLMDETRILCGVVRCAAFSIDLSIATLADRFPRTLRRSQAAFARRAGREVSMT